MAHIRPLRLPRVASFASTMLAVCLLGCSDDNRGPTIGAPQGPGPVIVEGGGSANLGGAGGKGASGAESTAGGLNVAGALNAGGAPFGAGGAPFGAGGAPFGSGGTGPVGTAGTSTLPFGAAGTGAPFGSGGTF